MFMWLIPMGWLTLRSGSMPRVLGWILVVGGVAGVLGTFVSVLAPDASVLAGVLPLAVIPGEVWIIGYLLIKGMPGRAPGARTRSFRGCGGVSAEVTSAASIRVLASGVARMRAPNHPGSGSCRTSQPVDVRLLTTFAHVWDQSGEGKLNDQSAARPAAKRGHAP